MTTTIVSQSNTESICNLAVLRFTTDANTAAAQVFTIGFVPRIVRLRNLTDGSSAEWYEGMAAGSAISTTNAGAVSLATTGGLQVNADGTVLVPAGLMVASKVFAMEAIG
jgi:hypothetical protein